MAVTSSFGVSEVSAAAGTPSAASAETCVSAALIHRACGWRVRVVCGRGCCKGM